MEEREVLRKQLQEERRRFKANSGNNAVTKTLAAEQSAKKYQNNN
jgi:hypothetical protein